MYTNANKHPGTGTPIVHMAVCRRSGLADGLSAGGGRAGIYLFWKLHVRGYRRAGGSQGMVSMSKPGGCGHQFRGTGIKGRDTLCMYSYAVWHQGTYGMAVYTCAWLAKVNKIHCNYQL